MFSLSPASLHMIIYNIQNYLHIGIYSQGQGFVDTIFDTVTNIKWMSCQLNFLFSENRTWSSDSQGCGLQHGITLNPKASLLLSTHNIVANYFDSIFLLAVKKFSN